MSTQWRLQQAVAALHAGRARLMKQDIDLTVEIAEELPEETAAVEAAIVAVARAAIEADDLEEAARKRAAAITDRARRFAHRAEQLRGVAFAAMDALGSRKIERGDLTVSIRAGQQVTVITDESLVPDEYWKTEKSLKRGAITDDLKVGVVIPGVERSNGGPSLIIKGS